MDHIIGFFHLLFDRPEQDKQRGESPGKVFIGYQQYRYKRYYRDGIDDLLDHWVGYLILGKYHGYKCHKYHREEAQKPIHEDGSVRANLLFRFLGKIIRLHNIAAYGGRQKIVEKIPYERQGYGLKQRRRNLLGVYYQLQSYGGYEHCDHK